LREVALAMAGKKTEKYRLDFSSERAPHINKPKSVKKIIEEGMGKIGRESQMGA
jgi:hypothetical protein